MQLLGRSAFEGLQNVFADAEPLEGAAPIEKIVLVLHGEVSNGDAGSVYPTLQWSELWPTTPVAGSMESCTFGLEAGMLRWLFAIFAALVGRPYFQQIDRVVHNHHFREVGPWVERGRFSAFIVRGFLFPCYGENEFPDFLK